MTDQPTPPPSQQPGYGAAPSYGSGPAAGGTPSAPVKAPPGTDFPGKTLGIVGLILAILIPLVGLILSIVARVQSKKAGYKNTLATAGIIVGAVLIALYIILWIVIAIAAASAIGGAVEMCQQLGPGTWEINGVTYTCS
ncbi:hypothetical protein GCM10010988_17240 [Cnuibacter physcomitrellae]|uniref:Uncharacterized protein n=2 Tax=Cnuibacter physcomitrellae TaxID=1619308 RepID=A0A1X9LTG6_9MICO|nr:DUF4190 domain-containing protein [Cnuibacter physcomitrellae]ARJ06469.1 hypothetical protein B5808_15540 [Cnuibacter physcomitrellae]GGI38090.1 hypothetical protein GCM10010988_17240 [Cnuibacter physcomitrellae]